jgi:hypothetical protein
MMEVYMRANKWEDSPQYQRILEILTDYWTSEPDEAYVEVDMKFVHANGEWQSKTICWFNPNMERKKIREVIPERWREWQD